MYTDLKIGMSFQEYLKPDHLGDIMTLEDAKYQILVECICENNAIVK